MYIALSTLLMSLGNLYNLSTGYSNRLVKNVNAIPKSR